MDPRPPYSADHSPLPAWAPVYNHVEYCPTDPSLPPVWRTSIEYAGVVDIGVGHVHWHEQYARITGGELQPMRTSGTTLDALSAYVPQPYFQLFEQLFPSLTNLDQTMVSLISTATYPMLYQFFNGPVRDGDGYIDGTCNLYALVQLKPNAALGAPDGYALLYQDEQSYFTQRWRLVHPDDYQGLMFALVPDLHADLQREPSRQLYHWNPHAYWCPFRSGYIGAQSRLAVAAQVLVVNGEDPARITETDRTRAALIVSINFSWATMDRTWRWRRLPDNVQARYFDTSGAARDDEPIGTDVADSAYPQTLGLRGDMTIVLKGTSNGQLGRWYQRYLPASNTLYPAVSAATGPLPGAGFTHPWKFVPEGVFTYADRFSHFGVYDQVDSRSQYYVVTPVSATDAQTLAAGGSGPWIDDSGQLFIQYAKFPWDSLRLDWPPALTAQWPPLPASPRRPSLFNADTRLRIVQRGSHWLALPWDKRDDDLLPIDGLPKTVQLKNGARTATVTLNTNTWLEQPPAVQSAYFWWEPSGACGVAFSAPQSPGALPFDNVWRVRMAALLAPNGDVLPLLDLTTEGRFSQTNEGAYEYRWTPGASERVALTQYASSLAARANGTSLWFEDVVGHAGVPDQVWWGRSSGMSVSLTPATIPLGIAVPVSVHAQDARTAAPLSGAVLIDGQAVGRTDAPFTFTFNTQRNRVFDPETRTWNWGEETVPAGVVRVADYPDSAIPFAFYKPLLRTWVEPATIPIGPTVQLTVHAEDATTHAAVAGQVLIGGQVVGSTNTPFNFAFNSAGVSGVVSAGDYPNRAITFALYMRQLHVWVEPAPLYIGRTTAVTVHAADAMTGTSVAGRVLIAGQDVGASNTTFNYTFGSSAPNAIVSAPYYDTAPVSWPALRQPRLVVSIQPYPVAAGTLTTYAVRATDGDSSAAVDGSVKVNGLVVARTNVPFSYRFVMQRVRTFDPETRTYTTELVAPTASVSASGYLEANLDLGLNTT